MEMALAGAITKFFTRTDTLQKKEDNEEILIAKKCKKNSTTETEMHGFLQPWLVEFEWLCYNGEANVMCHDFCQCAGHQLAGNTLLIAQQNSRRKILEPMEKVTNMQSIMNGLC